MSHREIEQHIEKLHQKIKDPNKINCLLITRAAHNINSGQPLNPQNEKSWQQGLTAELEGDYRADTDKSALDTSHALFANVLDPGYTYAGHSSMHALPPTPLARYFRSTAPTRDILESSPSDTSTVGEDPAMLIGQKIAP